MSFSTARHVRSAGLLDLPNELLTHIIDLLAQPSRFDPPFDPFRSRYFILMKLCMTCTRLRAVAQEALYARVHLPTAHHAALFQRTLASKAGVAAALASKIEQIIIRDGSGDVLIQDKDNSPRWLAPLLTQVAGPRLAKVSLISMGIGSIELGCLTG